MRKLFVILISKFCMKRGMSRLTGKKHKIFNPIISRISIYMMNNFRRCQESTKMLFHNKSMGSYISTIICAWMFRTFNPFERKSFSKLRFSSLPITSFFSFLSNRNFVFMRIRKLFSKSRFRHVFSPFLRKRLSFFSYMSKRNFVFMFFRFRTSFCKIAFQNIHTYFRTCLSFFSLFCRGFKIFFTNNTQFSHKASLVVLIILFNIISCQDVYSGQWSKSIPLDGDAKVDFPTDHQNILDAVDRMLSNYREGMKLTYSSGSTISVAAGEVMVSNSAGTKRLMLKNASATNVTFANIDTGAEANSTYYVWAVAATDASETATFKISLSSTEPDSTTYYARLGSFVNSGGDMEQVKNDNDSVIVSTGTITDGGTISLPSGYSQDECKWVSGISSLSTSNAYGLKSMDFSCNSSRVCQADVSTSNWVDGITTYSFTGTGQYIIVCHR